MRPALLTVLILLTALRSVAAADGEGDLFRFYYDAEVLSFCGMATARTEAGFERRLAHLLDRDGWSEAAHRAVRRRAWIAGHREWNNRSLGGHRAWCNSEGAATRRWLSAAAGRSP